MNSNIKNKISTPELCCVMTRNGNYSLRIRGGNGKLSRVYNIGTSNNPFQIVAAAPNTPFIVIKKFVQTKTGLIPKLYMIDTKTANANPMPEQLNAFEFLQLLMTILTGGKMPNMQINPFGKIITPMSPGKNISVIRRRRRRPRAAIRRMHRMRATRRNRGRSVISHKTTIPYSTKMMGKIKYSAPKITTKKTRTPAAPHVLHQIRQMQNNYRQH